MAGKASQIIDPAAKAVCEDLVSQVSVLSSKADTLNKNMRDVVEHTVQFAPHAAPAVDTALHGVASGEYRVVGGFASITGVANGAETIDVKVDGVSILNAPAAVGAAPGTLVPLVFAASGPFKYGKKIEYVYDDGGVASPTIPAVQVRWMTK